MSKAFANYAVRTLLIVITSAAVGACSRMEDKEMAVGGVNYRFPSAQVEAFTPPDKGELYVRLAPPGEQFDIIYSAQARYRRNWQGGDTPLVTSINDFPSRRFHKVDFPGGKTVCREDQPSYSCGLLIEDSGVTWSVVFDESQVGNSEAIRASAHKIIKAYRR